MNGRRDPWAMDFLVKNMRFLNAHPEFRGQVAAGEAAGVGQPAISKIIQGQTKEPGYRTVMGLARHYGVSIDDLLNRDLEQHGVSAPSQPVGLDDATMAQAVELLYLMADARPEDWRFRRLSWPMIQVAAKAISRAEGDARKAMAGLLSDLPKEVTHGA